MADSSGTTFVCTQQLSAISEAWQNSPGTGTTVNWPASNTCIASLKNDGVAATVKTPGAIGYIEYGFVKITTWPMTWLENRAGKFIEPTLESGQAALANGGAPGRPAGLALRPWRCRRLPHRFLHPDAVLQKVERPQDR